LIFASAAFRTHPTVRDLLEGCSGGDAIIRIAFGGIIDPTAYITNVFFHRLPFRTNIPIGGRNVKGLTMISSENELY